MNAGGIGPGVFVAVVGPSGAGKDTVIAGARSLLGARAEVATRWITRPVDATEQHVAVTGEDFERAELRGELVISWRAHGLRYGLPGDVDELIRRGRIVIANVSRTALERIEARYARVRIVRIDADPRIRRARLEARARESAADVAARAARPDPAPGHRVDLDLRNDGPPATAIGALARYLGVLIEEVG